MRSPHFDRPQPVTPPNKLRATTIFAITILQVAMSIAFAQPSSSTSRTPEKPTTAESWRALTLADLDSIERALREHTPIPVDSENIATREWLDKGLAEARGRAQGVTNETGWYYALAAYVNGFRDPHVAIRPSGELPPARWPGFIVAARGSSAVVAHRDATDADVPSEGAQILQCDGKSLSALAEERVYPFTLNPALPADQRVAVTRLFLDRSNPFAPAPQSCRIKSGDIERDIVLRWRALPKDGKDSEKEDAAWWQQFNNASIGSATEFGVGEPAPGVTWIGVPTFSSGGDAAVKLDQLIKDVEKRGAAMRDGRAIVIDTRGNRGGNSAWADRLANAIFTSAIVKKYRVSSSPAATDWRASEGNIENWKAFEATSAKEFGTFSIERFFPLWVASSMRNTLDEGKTLYRDGSSRAGVSGGLAKKRNAIASMESPIKARVYFLSNGTCGSSCLNFADSVLFIPGVKLIGAPTAADGMLMDVRGVNVASGLARLTIPMKVARGRARGNLEFYSADINYGGAWDDASVRTWVMRLLETETATK